MAEGIMCGKTSGGIIDNLGVAPVKDQPKQEQVDHGEQRVEVHPDAVCTMCKYQGICPILEKMKVFWEGQSQMEETFSSTVNRQNLGIKMTVRLDSCSYINTFPPFRIIRSKSEGAH